MSSLFTSKTSKSMSDPNAKPREIKRHLQPGDLVKPIKKNALSILRYRDVVIEDIVNFMFMEYIDNPDYLLPVQKVMITCKGGRIFFQVFSPDFFGLA